MVRLTLLAAALLFFLPVVPFPGRNEVNGFWQYSVSLCLRFIPSVLFSGVLFAGLAIALGALDNLFGIDVPGKRYLELWAIVAGMFATWFFLAGVPEDVGALNSASGYQKGLKTFAQFILFPLLLVYFGILYAYIVKILVEWSWPRGWVSGLIIGYAATGLLLLLLVHPLKDREDSPWIRSTWTWFIVSLAPLVVVLLLAMWRRISEYGITESRYLGVVLGLWLGAIVIYFLLSKGKDIRVLPASLGTVALLVSFGPWGAFDVSESDQVGRLRLLLERHSMIDGGMVREPRDTVPAGDRARISSIVSYLYGMHGYDRIQPWFAGELTGKADGTGARPKPPSTVTGMMGIEYTTDGGTPFEGVVFLNADPKSVREIGGYDRMAGTESIERFRLRGGSPSGEVAYRASPDLDTLTVIVPAGGEKRDSLAIGLRAMVEMLRDERGGRGVSEVPAGKMSVAAENRGLKVKIFLRSIRIERRSGEVGILGYDADIFYSVGEKP